MASDRAKKTPSGIHWKAAANGGHILTHHFDNFGAGESYQPSQDHAFSTHADMVKHFSTMTGGKPTTHGGKATPDKEHDAAPAGVAGHAKAAAPTRRTHGAGVD